MPEQLAYLLDIFYQIKTIEPITYQEIDSWNRLTNYKLKPFEVQAVRMLDLTFTK